MEPTRYLSNGRRVYKTKQGKYVTRTGTYRPKVTHFTYGTRRFAIMPHNRVPYGMKPVVKYSQGLPPQRRRISSQYTMLKRILSRRAM